jgi:hypothetical protein
MEARSVASSVRRRLPAVPSYAGRQSRNRRRLRRQLKDRQLGLTALAADLRFLCRFERFLSMYDPAAKAPEPVASAQREVR